MNESSSSARNKQATFRHFLPQAIIGLLLGSGVGFVSGMEVAPLIGSFLVRPSALILDPAAMLVGIIIIALCAVGGAVLGGYVALRAERGAK
jgi:hypothetical protein